jgi:hypothetical protein
MIAYAAQLGLAMLALFLLGGLIGGLAWRRFGKPPAQPEASGPSQSA